MSSLDREGRPIPERYVSNNRVDPIEWRVTAIVQFLVVLPGDWPTDEVEQECLRALQAGEYEEMKIEDIDHAEPA